MKKLIILTCLALLSVAIPAFAQTSPATSPAPTGSPGAKMYTCPMHSEVLQDKPGKCPKCGMKLEPKKEDEKEK